MATIEGSCLCKGVRYAVDSESIGFITTCYCSYCRKGHGAERRLRAVVATSAFRWLAGKDLLTRYAYRDNRAKIFCRTCGTPLVNTYLDDDSKLGLAIATLDADPGKRNVLHLFAASRPEWIEIRDDLPRFDSAPDLVGTVTSVSPGHVSIQPAGAEAIAVRVASHRPEDRDAPVSPGDRVRASLAHGEDFYRLHAAP